MGRRYTIVMGCNESREGKKISSISAYSFKTPLPLHLYQYSPKSSPTNHSTNQSPKSPNKSPTNQSPKSPTNQSPKSHLSKLNTIAHFKFPMFREFQPNVQQEILLHIDKELRKQ
jgi:hypothetical protein